jgi:phage terminase large subunit-like protein
VMQRLVRMGIPVSEYPQTVPNLTAATSNLFDLISARQLVLYPDAGMRLAASRAIIVESSRGWRLDKLKQQHKIDSIVALSMAALCAIQEQSKYRYDSSMDWVSGPTDDSAAEKDYLRQRFQNHLHGGYFRSWR